MVQKVLLYILVAATTPVAHASTFNEPASWYSSVRQSAVPKNPMELQEKRKMGVGTVLSGATGLVGAHLHFNIGQDFNIGAGYGGSSDMKAFTAYFRHLLTNATLSFYWTAGYARWWSAGGRALKSSTPDYLYEKFLSGREKESGRFVEHIFYPGLGLQFYKLGGEYEGMSFFAEGLLMSDIEDLVTTPALGLGALFYF